ncbi:MAG: TerD family protein, partial [Runella zeae]
VDLDLTCVSLDHRGEICDLDLVTGSRCRNSNGSVMHSGDDLRGDSVGDDEAVDVCLESVPEHVYFLLFPVCVRGKTFAHVTGAYVRVCECEDMGQELVRLSLEDAFRSTLSFVFYRASSTEWMCRVECGVCVCVCVCVCVFVCVCALVLLILSSP